MFQTAVIQWVVIFYRLGSKVVLVGAKPLKIKTHYYLIDQWGRFSPREKLSKIQGKQYKLATALKIKGLMKIPTVLDII